MNLYLECIKITQFDLPILIEKIVQPKIDLTEIYNHCFSLRDQPTSNIDVDTMEKFPITSFYFIYF